MRLVPASLLALALAAPARAGVVVHDYAGVITAVFDGNTGMPIDFPEFRVGDAFTGCFAWDTDAVDSYADPILGNYASAAHAWRFESASVVIEGAEVMSHVALFAHAESIGVTAHQAVLPAGWSSPASLSDSFSVFLQNVPSTGVHATDALPPGIDLSQWTSFREMRLDFYNGVTSPTATTATRLLVQGEVTSLALAGPGAGCGGGGSVDAECPASRAWGSHGEYVSCVAKASQELVRAGLMTRAERQEALTSAAQSEAGK